MTIEEANELSPYAWSPDGEMLAFQFLMEGTSGDIGVLTMYGEHDWEPLLQTEAWESTATISPDGAAEEPGCRSAFAELQRLVPTDR